MKTVLILGGPAAGQQIEVHGTMRSVFVTITPTHSVLYHLYPLASHGEVHWFGVLDGADPLALLIAGYAPAYREMIEVMAKGTHPAEAAEDFSSAKNREGEAPVVYVTKGAHPTESADDDQLEEGVTAEQVAAEASAWSPAPDFRMRENY